MAEEIVAAPKFETHIGEASGIIVGDYATQNPTRNTTCVRFLKPPKAFSCVLNMLYFAHAWFGAKITPNCVPIENNSVRFAIFHSN